MFYFVDGRIKKLSERIIDISQYDYTGVYLLELLRFTDGSIMFAEECQELSFKGLCEYLRMRRTKLLMKFHYLVADKAKTIDSIF